MEKFHRRTGAMRTLQYFFVLLAIAGALVFLAPYVDSEPVRAEVAPTTKASKASKASKAEKQKTLGENFWSGPFPSVEISFEPEEWEFLQRDNRRYCKATLVEGTKTYKAVALKLKGSAGSFQGPDGKPGLTINFDIYKGGDPFHGLRKIHFNNGAQDGTYLFEQIAGEIARKAGVPASRCSHGFVKFQGRDLGLYVVKEAFTKEFLSAFYKNVDGDLFDGGFVRGIDENSEKDSGDPKDKAAIKELIAACNEGDNAKRWERLGKILDVDLFASYFAMEAILCHWDGYSFNSNNYRFYCDPDSKKFSFFLHGMDQTFGDVNFSIRGDSGALVSSAFMRCPEGAKLYKAKLLTIYENVLKPIDWSARVTELGGKVREALEKRNPQSGKDYARQISSVRDRVAQRIANVGKMLGDMPKPFEFDAKGIAKIPKDWRTEGDAAQMEERNDEGTPSFYLRADGDTNGSWRRMVVLEPGEYRFEARLRTKGVVASQGSSGEGAGLRISGSSRSGVNALSGDAAWQNVAYPFTASGGEIMLVMELRAAKGELWCEKGSVQIVRVK